MEKSLSRNLPINLHNHFSEKVYIVVRRIPFGKVMSYGQIALFLDKPRSARGVGWVLSRISDSDMVPWWRVVNNEGRISIKGRYSAEEQRQLLREEGIEVSEDFTFDIEKYRHKPGKKSGADVA